jgi:hypothetical protein
MTTYRAHLPPIYREAKNLVVLIEQVVRQFSRYHRYTLGTDLRLQAMQLLRLVHKAWRDKSNQSKHLKNLVWAIDDLKLTLQTAKECHALTSFAQFEHLAQQTRSIGKQCGGWLKTVLAATSQNAQDGAVKTALPSCGELND